MGEELFFLGIILILFVFSPVVISIIALVKASGLKSELHSVRKKMDQLIRYVHELEDRLTASDSPSEPEPIAQQVAEVSAPTPVAEETVIPQAHEPELEPEPKQEPVCNTPIIPVEERLSPPAKPKPGFEFMMGGKAAAFAGIAILIVGIVFLVGYSIQHSWIGPGTRIILGLLSGGLLVGLGHFLLQKDAKYTLFARVLTGGGCSLFYFSVFAAYGVYHLIGPVAAGGGLFVSALAVFGLSMVYRSQSVGVLGVLGAFITPFLVGGDLDAGNFQLVYVALINVPVIFLGVHRKWQVLYNSAFVFTIIHFMVWFGTGNDALAARIGFALLFFAQFAALGLFKLRCEQETTGRVSDMARLILSSVLLLLTVYLTLDHAEQNQWIGGAFLILAVVHVLLAKFAFKVLTKFNYEILTFLAGGILFATLALPAQLNGEWVSLGWAIEGLFLAWFATRVKSKELQAAAILLGLIGIMKTLAFDGTLYASSPNLFLNPRFAVGLLSCIALGIQGKWAARFSTDEGTSSLQDVIWWASIIGGIVFFFSDTFWTLGTDEPFSWLMTSLMLFVSGVVVVLFAPKRSTITCLGSVLLLLVPFKFLIIDSWFHGYNGHHHTTPFLNPIIWVQLVVLIITISLLRPRLLTSKARFILPTPSLVTLLNLGSIASGIGVISIEILRKNSDWAQSGVTILWAISALALIILGMKRRTASNRYFGLALFALTTIKVLLIDSSELSGLERIAAFMGTGVLLLALSFIYQKASAFFHAQGDPS